MRRIMPYVATTAFALASATPLSAADSSQVNAIVENVRANGSAYVVHGLSIREIIVNSSQIGYEGNYEINFAVPQDKVQGVNSLFVSVRDLSGTNEVVNMSDGDYAFEPPGPIPSIDGVIDVYEKARETPGETRQILASGLGRDAQALGQGIYDRVVASYYKFITR